MAEQEQLANAGDQVSNAPAALGLSTEAQFRNINARLDALTDQVSRLAKPPTFRIADIIQLGVIVVGLAIALISAFGLNERVNDVGKTQIAAENRLTASVTASEARVTSRLDKLGEQVTKVGERTATIEGRQSR